MSEPDFVAKKSGEFWTIQVACGTGTRDYVIRMSDGALFELPDDRVPFVVFKSPNAND
ncbi:hypothetical protein [Noviluteimonas gilva]|uniref:Uncharacterized protein n=1 Tax=Noviluteimonas gilva TaxID=2682097 RepID=A0A7C9HLB2_9GAMM|nr:hypothetical protein [Lysobacter gilvus]MUV13592.1 hypothetical protein [Lysobacter gilvus]